MRDFQGVSTDQEVDLLVKELLEGPDLFAFDVETGYTSAEPAVRRSVETRHPDFVVVGFSVTNDPSWARYIPLRHAGESNLDPLRTWEAFRPVLENKQMIAHNASFERAALNSLARAGDAHSPIVPKHVGHDTMLLANSLGTYKEVGLKFLTAEVLGEEQKSFASLFGESVLDKNGKISAAKMKRTRLNQLPVSPEVIAYGCDDSALCLELFNEFYPQLTEAQRRSYMVEMQIMVLMSQAEEFGVAVDWTGMEQALSQYKNFKPKFEKKVREEFAEMTVDPAIKELARSANFASPVQMRRLLYDGLNMKTTRTTKTGAQSTDAQALEALSRKHPAVRSLLSLREIDNLGRRLKKWLDEYSWYYDGRVHPSFSQTVAITGRFAASSPAIQQLGKDWFWSANADGSDDGINGEDYWSGNFRNFIIAGENSKLLTFDYCVAPDTRLLTSDLRWVRAADVQVGDELIGFPERFDCFKNNNDVHAWQRTKVLRKSTPKHQSYKITTDDGRVIVSSADHMWATRGDSFSPKKQPDMVKVNGPKYRAPSNRKWTKTKDLKPGVHTLSHFVMPWTVPTSVEEKVDHAYLSGLMDGEGWINKGKTVGFGQAPGLVWDRFVELAAKYDYPLGSFHVRQPGDKRNKVVNTTYISGRDAAIRFIAKTKPLRLFEKQSALWEGYRSWSHYSKPVGIVSVEPVGVIETVSLETDTHTFIAEGLMSHNCSQEIRVLAGITQEMAFIERLDRGEDPHKIAASIVFGVPYEHVTKEQRSAAKTIQFAVLYGMGAKSMAERLAMTPDEAQEIMDTYKARLPRVGAWDAKSRIVGIRDKKIATWFGREVTLWDADSPDSYTRSHAERLAVNAQIQGGAADYTKLAMLRSWQILQKHGLWGPDKVMLTMNQHDSLTFEFNESLDVNFIRSLLQEAVVFDAQKMFPKLNVPKFPVFDVDWEMGKAWGSSVGWPLDVEAVKVNGSWGIPDKPEAREEVVAWDKSQRQDDIPSVTSVSFGEMVLHAVATNPNAAGILKFKELVASRSGETRIHLTVGPKTVRLGSKTSLSLADSNLISMVLGGAKVYERSEEDMETIMDGSE